MKQVVSCDPGLRCTGIGEFHDGVLRKAFLARNPVKQQRGAVAWRGMAHAAKGLIVSADVLVLERQQIYTQKKWKGNQDDVLQLTGVCGALAALIIADEYVEYLPRDWKGQVPQDVMANRILSKLEPEEKAVVDACGCPPYLLHNVAHGIGLGLYYLGRL